MEAIILACFDLDDEEVEIMLPVTFTAMKGYPATHEDPGCPAEVCDIEFDETTAIRLVKEYLGDDNIDNAVIIYFIDNFLEKPETEAKLLDFANQMAKDREDERSEYLYEQMKARKRGE